MAPCETWPALIHRLAEDPVAVFEDRRQDDLVGAGPGVGLDVGITGPEDVFGPRDRQGFELIDDFATAVEAGADEAFGRLVLNDGAQRRQNGARALVLGGDQLERVALSFVFGVDEPVDIMVRRLLQRAPSSPSWYWALFGNLAPDRLDYFVDLFTASLERITDGFVHRHA